MSGAGSVNVAVAEESSFLGSLVDSDADNNTDYYEPFKDPTIQELTLDRALQRQRMPDQVFADQSVAGNMEGAFAIQGTLDDSRIDDLHTVVFNSSNPFTISSGLAQTSRWFITMDYVDGGSISTNERVLKGCAPVDYTLEYTQGEDVRITVAFIYADEVSNTSETPTDIFAADGNAGRWHGVDLDINATTQVKEESITLSLTNMSQFERGSKKLPEDAVVGPAQASLDLTATFSETDQQELAYGASGNTTTNKTINSVSGTLTVDVAGSTVATYNLASMKPTSHGLDELLTGEGAQEVTSWHINGDPAVDIS